MEKLNVFFVCSWYPNRTNPHVGFFHREHAKAIARHCNIVICYVDADPEKKSREPEFESSAEDGLKTYITYFRPSVSPLGFLIDILNYNRYLLRTYRQHRKSHGKPDIIHYNVASYTIFAILYLKLFHSTRYIYTEHCSVPMEAHKGWRKQWLKWRITMKLSSLFAGKTTVCSKAMQRAFNFFNLSQDIEIIYPAVHLDSSPSQAFSSSKKLLLHISLLTDVTKNVSGMMRAVERISREREDFEFHVLGMGEDYEKHLSYAKELGVLDKTVFFEGFADETTKAKWLDASVCHILFSNYEGFSIVTAESLLRGKPVIVSRCGGPEDFVTPEQGILVDIGNEDQLAEAIRTMLDKPDAFDPERLRSYAKQKFSPATVGEQFFSLYRRVLGLSA